MNDGVTPRLSAAVGLPSELPRGWQSKQLRRVASAKASNVDKKTVDGQASVLLCNYVDVYYNRQIVSNLDFMEATATDEQAVNFELLRGDVLITKDSETPSDIGVPAFVVADLPGVLCGYHLSHIRPGKELSGAFLTYCFQAGGIQDHFYSNATGVTRFGLSRSDIGTCPIPLPLLGVQQTIAAHLDRETAKIDTLIAKKRELIAKLKEHRSALISRTVTRGLPPEAAQAAGLDPNPPMKDSGVEWIGEMPAHWRVMPVSKISSLIQTGPFGTQLHNSDYVEDEIPLINPLHLIDSEIVPDFKTTVTQETTDRLSRYKLVRGDIVFARRGDIGRCAVTQVHQDGWLCGTGSMVVRFASSLPNYFATVFQSRGFRETLELRAVGTTMLNLNPSILGRMVVPAPPIDEQSELLEYLNRKGVRYAALLTSVQTAITHLTEYRAALITAAVTGQLDVTSTG